MSEAPLVDPGVAHTDPSAADTAARQAPIAPAPAPAEEAAQWLASWGEQGSTATSEVTVHADQAVALVCCGVRVGRAELTDLVEYAGTRAEVRRLYLFSDTAFGSRVTSMADEAGVALFWWDETGSLQPVGSLAHHRFCTVPARACESAPPPSPGKRRAAVPVDAPVVPARPEPLVAESRVAESPVVQPVVQPVLWESMAPLEHLELPDGDPLFTPLSPRTGQADQILPAVEASWGGWTEYLPVEEVAGSEAVDRDPATAENPVLDPVSRALESTAVESTPDVAGAEVAAAAPREVTPTEAPPAQTSSTPGGSTPGGIAGAPVAAAAQATPEGQATQIDRYLDLLHNRAAAHGMGSSRRALPADQAATESVEPAAAPPRRFADPTRQVAGGPDAAARSAATLPAAPIEGLTPEMIFPRQAGAPLEESVAAPSEVAAGTGTPAMPGAGGEGSSPQRGKRRGWFARRPDRAAVPGGSQESGSGGQQRSYQLKRTLEARRVMLETGLPPVTEVPEAMDWLRSGDRARAIAVYRKAVGVGLVEAIDALDALGHDY